METRDEKRKRMKDECKYLSDALDYFVEIFPWRDDDEFACLRSMYDELKAVAEIVQDGNRDYCEDFAKDSISRNNILDQIWEFKKQIDSLNKKFKPCVDWIEKETNLLEISKRRQRAKSDFEMKGASK